MHAISRAEEALCALPQACAVAGGLFLAQRAISLEDVGLNCRLKMASARLRYLLFWAVFRKGFATIAPQFVGTHMRCRA